MPHDDEFSNLLDFGMQFSDLDGHDSSDRLQLHPVSHPTSLPPTSTSNEFVRMDTDVSYDRMMDNFSIDVFSNQNGLSQDQVEPSYPNNGNMPQFYGEDIPRSQHLHVQPPQKHQQLPRQQSHQLSHQQHSSHQYPQPVIPPTPNSIELHGNAARQPQQMDENHELYDRYTHMNDEQVWVTTIYQQTFSLTLANMCVLTGALHPPHLSCHDTFRNAISTSRIHDTRRVLYSTYIPGS